MTDVLIIGSGPAGMSAAILCKTGKSECTDRGKRI